MKKKHLLFAVFACCLTLTPLDAAIWRINNNDGSADYAQIQHAIDDRFVVLVGDTLMLEGSPVNYSGATIDRTLTILGPGYLHTENPQTPVAAETAVIAGGLNLYADGCKASGIKFDGVNYAGVYIEGNNCLVTKCYFNNGGVYFRNCSGSIIRGNILKRVGLHANYHTATNVTMTNNIFLHNVHLTPPRVQISICENNIFTANSLKIRASTFRNNIITSTSTNLNNFEIVSGNLQNNLFAGNQIDPVQHPTNQVSIDMAQVFVGPGSFDGQYQLNPNSIARGAGFGGTDCGIFGGNFPYVLSGIGDIPLITDLRTDGSGNTQTGLKIYIKARSY